MSAEVNDMSTADLERVNRELGGQPEALVDWALSLDRKPVVSTGFGPFSAVLLHLVTERAPDTPVLWVDAGTNTPETYRYADDLTRRLGLNLHVFQPLRSRARREALDGPPPAAGTPRFDAFVREVKLEPFERAIAELKPGVWLTAVRADETAERARMQPVSLNADGILKVAPVLRWNARQMHDYLKRHGLPNNFDYLDPTKPEAHRECGLHLAH